MEKFFDFAFEPQLENTDEMYFRSNGFSLEQGVFMAKNETASISFDTYFNMIPVNKLRKFTSAEKIFFEIEGDAIETELFSVSENGTVSLGKSCCIDICDIPENEVYIFPKIKAAGANPIIRSISVFLDGEISNINAALIICTYNREEYVIPNVNYLSAEIEKRGLPIKIILVDNAKTLSEAQFPDKAVLISNENTGGSGGFGRGMKAAAEMKEFTHFILMDDDVKFDFVSFEKLLGFLKFRNKESENISISGSMLYLDKPDTQFESGGFFTENGIQKGCGHFLDMTDRKNLLDNEQPKNINYGGWWLMCIPMKYVNDGNYPLPFFIKYDDVEYALRCRLDIITLNGVSVWHEPFEWKYNSSSEYYNMRNFLFLRSITDSSFTKRQAKKIAHKQILENHCRQQYKMAEAVKLGYEDFLKGMDFLYELGPDENHQKICRLNYEMLSEEELSEKYGVKFSREKYEESLGKRYRWYMRPLLYGLLIPKCFCKKDYAVVDAFFDRKEMYFGISKVLHYNPGIKRGYLTYKKKGQRKI